MKKYLVPGLLACAIVVIGFGTGYAITEKKIDISRICCSLQK